MRRLFILLAFQAVFSAQCFAFVPDDESPNLMDLTLEELLKVSIATGVRQNLFEVPAIASVITAQDFEMTGATDLDDALQNVPGLHIAKYFIGYNSIYMVRGIYQTFNPHVLFLVNGVPVNHLYLGNNRGFMWGGMPTNGIERVELIRGPGSALYGADAFSGVVNIITKSKENIEGTQIGGRVGSFNTYDAWLLHGGAYNGFDTALTVEYHDTDGYRKIIDSDVQTNLDKAFRTHASRAPGPLNTQGRTLDARLNVVKENWQLRMGYQGRYNMGVGVGNSQALDPNGRTREQRTNADLTYHNPKLTKYWDVTAQLSYLDSRRNVEKDWWLYPPGAFGGAFPNGLIGNPGISERHVRANLSGFYSGISNHTIRLGTGYFYGDMYKVKHVSNYVIDPVTRRPIPTPSRNLEDYSDTPLAFLPEKNRRNWNIFLQDAWKFATSWELTAGIRYDNYSDFGTTINPRLALVWQTRKDFTAKLLYGKAFRAPSMYELYNSNNPINIGNSKLKPEIINTYELAFDYRATKNLNFSLNTFLYKMTDVIRFAPDAKFQSFTADNVGKQNGKGFELEATWKVNQDIKLSANYAYQKSIDKEYNVDAGYAPHHTAYLRADWQFFPHWYVNTQMNWVADRKRSFGDPRPTLADYTIVDLTLHYRVIVDKNTQQSTQNSKNPWRFALSVRNLFNADAREPSPGPNVGGAVAIPNDLPLPGRSYFAQIGYDF